MNDTNLINCLAQKQLKELDFEIKFNSSLKNKFNVGNSKNPFEPNFASPGVFRNGPPPADSKQANCFSLFNYDKNANLIQKPDSSFGNFVGHSDGCQPASSSPAISAINPPKANYNLFGAQNNRLLGNLSNWNPNSLTSCSSTTNWTPNQQASNPSFNGNTSLFGHTPLNYNSTLNSNQLFNTGTLQSSSSSASHQANPIFNNFNPFLDNSNQPNSQSDDRAFFFNLNDSNLSDEPSSSLNGFGQSSNDFNSLLGSVSSTNSLTKAHLPSQNKAKTNCDLINLDSSSVHQEAADKYSIFKEILLSNDKNEARSESKIDPNQDNAKTQASVGSQEDLFSISKDLNESFGEFESFGESFGEFKSYNNFSPKPLSDSDKISEPEKLARFEKMLNGVLSIFHRSFNVLNIYYDERSVLSALSTRKGKEFYLDLREVYYVSKRIGSSLAGTKSCENLLNLIDEINKLWSLLDKKMSSLQVRQILS